MLSHSSRKANTSTGGSEPMRSRGYRVLFLHAFNRLETFSKLRLQKGKVAATNSANSDHSNQSQATVWVIKTRLPDRVALVCGSSGTSTDCRYWGSREPARVLQRTRD